MDIVQRSTTSTSSSFMNNPLETAKRGLKQYRSILDMMKGNTPVGGLKELEMEWLDPIRDRIRDLETARSWIV